MLFSKLLIAGLIGSVASPVAMAANAFNTQVSYITTGPLVAATADRMYLGVTTDLTTLSPATPACNTQRRYVIQITTDVGEAVLSMLEEAQAAGRAIDVVGTANCSFDSTSEGVAWVVVH